jgi:hypothetical protein
LGVPPQRRKEDLAKMAGRASWYFQVADFLLHGYSEHWNHPLPCEIIKNGYTMKSHGITVLRRENNKPPHLQRLC